MHIIYRWTSSIGIFYFVVIFMDYYLLSMLVIILIILAILHKLGKNKKPLLRAFGSMIIVNVTSVITQVHIPISMFTVGVSAGGGVPAVALLLFLNLL